jgi:hypothetical protein
MKLEYPRIEELIDQFFQRGIDRIQTLNVGSAGKMLGNLIKVLKLNFRIPALFGIKDDVWALLTGAKAHIRLDFDVGEPLGGDFLF